MLTLAPARLTALAEACAADSPAMLAAQRAHKHASRIEHKYDPELHIVMGMAGELDFYPTPLQQLDVVIRDIVFWAEAALADRWEWTK